MLLIGKLQIASNIIAQESVVDYNRFAFQPNIPLTDTLSVSAHLVNDSANYEETQLIV